MNLELRQEHLRIALEAAPVSIVMVNHKGQLMLVNQQTERLFGYTREELLGKPVEVLVPPRWRERHPGYREIFFGNPQPRAMGAGRELFGLKKDGAEVPVEIGLNPVETSEGMFVLATIIDISERKRLERMREDFLNIVAHDLRTPLTVIAGGTSNLLDGIEGELSPSQKEAVQVMARNSSMMIHLVNNLLDLACLESGKVPLNRLPLEVRSMARESIEAIRPLAREKGIEIIEQCPALPPILADRNLIAQVFNNLLGNAIRFANKKIVVGSKPQGTEVEFFVEDDGPGIREEDLPRLFNKFESFAALNPEGKRRGTGLGLMICKEIVEKHSGRIGVESRFGKGSVFRFTLPAEAGQEATQR